MQEDKGMMKYEQLSEFNGFILVKRVVVWLTISVTISCSSAYGKDFEYKFLGFDTRGFVESALSELSHDERNKLDLSTPSRFQLKAFVGTTEEAADFYMVGMLGRLNIGGAFFDNAEVLSDLSHLDLEKIVSDERFESVPEEHRKLLEWLLSQPDRSVHPHEFLAESIRITNGQVFKALLVGWDVLATGWNGRLGIGRDAYPKTKKLAPIPHVSGDLFPGWYHMWGVMAYSFFLTANTRGVLFLPELTSLLWITVEELLGLMNRRVESALIRAEHDFSGARAGSLLYKIVKSKKLTAEPNYNYIYEAQGSIPERILKLRTLTKNAAHFSITHAKRLSSTLSRCVQALSKN